MKALKIRCSAIGKIMATPRSKTEFLSQTAKSYIQELVLEHKFGIKKEFSSRYTDKGNEVEELSIALCKYCNSFSTKCFKLLKSLIYLLLFLL